MARNLLILGLALTLAACGSFRNLDDLQFDDGDAEVNVDTAADTADAPDIGADTADSTPDAPEDAEQDSTDTGNDDADMAADTNDAEMDIEDVDSEDMDAEDTDADEDVEPDAEDCDDCPAKLHAGPTADSICATKNGELYCWGDNAQLQLADPARVLRVRYPQEVPGAGRIDFLRGGGRHVCAVNSDAELWCWGANGTSQLGLSGPDSSEPRQVMAGVTDVAAGLGHTCARSANDVYCWGDNRRGQTGEPRIPSSDPVPTPALVDGNPGAVRLSAGENFTCMTTDTDRVVCWGDNTGGQIGTSPASTRCTGPDFGACSPVDYGIGLEQAPTSLSTGRQHACATTTTGLYCWGRNDQFQTSPDAGADTHLPAEVIIREGVDLTRAVASGNDHNCAITLEGTAACWGVNEHGRAGQPSEINAVRNPAIVALEAPIHQLAGGWRHTCALREGQVYCWGDGFQGQIGVGFVLPGPTPQAVDLTDVDQVTAGGEFTCALRDRAAYCWGDNEFGQMGDEVPVQRPAPFAVPTEIQFESIHTSGVHACGYDANGTMFCWGNNRGLPFGVQGNPWNSVPREAGITRARSVASGYNFTCAVNISDSLFCWGQNACGQVGRDGNSVQSSPMEFAGHWRSVAAGRTHACALDSAGAVHCWGGNEYGQVGSEGGVSACGQSSVFKTPTEAEVYEMHRLALGSWHSCALNEAGEVSCWGRADSGQLGRPVIPEQGWSSEAVRVDIEEIAQLVAGEAHTCARTGAGKVYCWGSTAGGRLGGPADNLGCDGQCQLTPLELDGLSDVVDLAATASSTCAALGNGEVYCWGQNHKGQLGIGSFESQATPQLVRLQ